MFAFVNAGVDATIDCPNNKKKLKKN